MNTEMLPFARNVVLLISFLAAGLAAPNEAEADPCREVDDCFVCSVGNCNSITCKDFVITWCN